MSYHAQSRPFLLICAARVSWAIAKVAESQIQESLRFHITAWSWMILQVECRMELRAQSNICAKMLPFG